MFLPCHEIKIIERIDHLAKPIDGAALSALYEGEEGELMLEAVSMEDMDAKYLSDMDYMPSMMLEAIKAKAARLDSRMMAFSRALDGALGPIGVSVEGRDISKPKKSGAVAIQIAKIKLSDGQSVSLVFHAPDNDPLKINADDTLIAFRFLLNSRDVTHVVAPAGGRDISLKQTALALSNLVEKNAPKFAKAQELKQSQQKELEQAQAEMERLEAETEKLSEKVDEAESKAEQARKKIATYQRQIDNQNEIQAELRKQLESQHKSGTAEKLNGETKPKGRTGLDNRLLESAAFKAASQAVKNDGNGRVISSLINIAGIDGGDPDMRGFDRSLMVSNLAGRVKTLHKQGHQLQVNNVLTLFDEYNKIADKPVFTARHSIWKLGEINKTPEAVGGESGEKDQGGDLYWYGLQMRPYDFATVPNPDGVVKYLNAEEAKSQFPEADFAVRHGAVAYAEPLTDKQVSDYELNKMNINQAFPSGDEGVAEEAVMDYLEEWMSDNGKKSISRAELDEIKSSVADKGFKQAGAKLLRRQRAFLNRKEKVDQFYLWEASLELVTPEMIESLADMNNLVKSDVREGNEKKVGALSELTKGKSMPDGWTLHDNVEGSDDLDNEVFIGVIVDSPLEKIYGGGEGSYFVTAQESGEFSVLYSEGSEVAKGLDSWEQIKAALIGAYVEDLNDEDVINEVIKSDYLDELNALRQQEGLSIIQELDEDGELPQHQDSGSTYVTSIEALIKSLNSGVLALKDAREMLANTIYHNIPEVVRADILGRNKEKSKKKWIGAVSVWLERARHYDANAPVVQVAGEVYDFNQREFDIVLPDLFGKSWHYVGKTNPSELIRAFDLFGDETKQALTEAAQRAYMGGVKPEQSEEPEQEAQDDKPTLKKVGDTVRMGAGTYRIKSILGESAELLDLDDGEVVIAAKRDLERSEIYIEGISQLPESEEDEIARLKGILKDLPMDNWFDKTGLSYTAQDAIYDALVSSGYDRDKAMATAQRIRAEHNSGQRPYVETYTNKPALRTPEEIKENLSELFGKTDKTSFVKKGKAAKPVHIKLASLTETGGREGASLNDGVFTSQVRGFVNLVGSRAEENFSIYGASNPTASKFIVATSRDTMPADSYDEVIEVLGKMFGWVPVQAEQPEAPETLDETPETEQGETMHMNNLMAIRDFTTSGEPDLALLDEFQGQLEAAYQNFEQLGVLDEHNDLLEAAFANLVELQTKVAA